jgi:hypothetical protein
VIRAEVVRKDRGDSSSIRVSNAGTRAQQIAEWWLVDFLEESKAVKDVAENTV